VVHHDANLVSGNTSGQKYHPNRVEEHYCSEHSVEEFPLLVETLSDLVGAEFVEFCGLSEEAEREECDDGEGDDVEEVVQLQLYRSRYSRRRRGRGGRRGTHDLIVLMIA
jgi:hypothetical protein